MNDNGAIDGSGITEGQTEIAVCEKVVQKEDIPVGKVGKEFEATVVPEKQFKESSIYLETSYKKFRTMGEAVKYAYVLDKQTEGSVESEVLPEGASGTAELLP